MILTSQTILRWFAFLILATLILHVGQGYVNIPIEAHHEGTIIYPAYLIKHGARPLKDVVIQHPPTTSYLYATAMAVGGERLLVTRWTTLAGIALLTVLLAACIGQVANLWAACAVAFLWTGTTQLIENIHLPWSTQWGLVCLLVSLLLSGVWCENGRKSTLAWAGFWIGLCLLFRINLGAAALFLVTPTLAGIAYLKYCNGGPSWIRSFLPFPSVAFLTILIGGGLMAIHAGDWESIKRIVDFQKTVAQERVFGLAACFSLDVQGMKTTVTLLLLAGLTALVLHPKKIIVWVSVAAIAAIVFDLLVQHAGWLGIDPRKTVPGFLAIAVVCLFVQRKTYHTPTFQKGLLATAAGLATWTINYPMPGIPQAMWASSGALIAVGQIVFRIPVKASPNRWLAFAIAVAMAFLAIPNKPLDCIYIPANYFPATITEGFYQGIKDHAEWIEDYLEVRTRISEITTAEDPILIWRMESLHYCDLERVPATLPYIHLDRFIYNMQTGPAIEQELLEQLKKRPPKAILVDTHHENDAWPSWYRNTHREIAVWIARHYAFSWESPNKQYCLLTPQTGEVNRAKEWLCLNLLDYSHDELLRILHKTVSKLVLDAVKAGNPSNTILIVPSASLREPAGLPPVEQLASEECIARLRLLPADQRNKVLGAMETYVDTCQTFTQQGHPPASELQLARENWMKVIASLHQRN